MATDNVVTVAFRLAFPEVFAPKAAAEGGKEKFSVTMLFPKDGSKLLPGMNGNGADVMALRKLAFQAIKEKWGEDKAKWPANLKTLDFANYLSPTGKDGWPFRDGDTQDWDGFAGAVFIRASSQYKPGIVDAKVQPILSQDKVFGGLICRAQINAYAYDNSGNKGVTFGLNNLQILKDDGTTFSGRQNATDVFEAVDDGGGTMQATGTDDEFFG